LAEKTPSIVGRNVRRLRESRGMSGNALAKAAGMAQSQVWDLEAGRTQNPTAPVLQALARALGVTVDELLREDPPGTLMGKESEMPQGATDTAAKSERTS